MNSAIGELGRLITEDPANDGVAEVIWAALRGVVLAQMIVGTPIDWQSGATRADRHGHPVPATLGRSGRPMCCNDVMSRQDLTSEIADIEAIKQVKYRYLRALDTKRWDDFADTLTDDVIGDYGSSVGEELHFTNRVDLVNYMRKSLGPAVITEHRVTHPEITVTGDEASGTLVPAGPGHRRRFQLHADRCGLLPRPLPAHRRRLEDQRHRLRPNL